MTPPDSESALKEETKTPLMPSWRPTHPVLIIEPDPTAGQLLKTYFQKWDYPCKIVDDPKMALNFVQDQPISLIILDLFLPPQKQQAFLRQLKELAPTAPLILTTTSPSVETAVEALREGAVDYLSKPFTETAFCQAFNRAWQPEPVKSDRLLENMFDSITEGIYVLDRNLRVILVNQAESERLHLPLAQIRGKRFDRLGWQEAAPRVIELIRQTFATGQKQDWLTNEISQSSLVTNREIHLYPIFSPHGQIRYVIVLAEDTTAQKQLQAALFQSANLTAIGQLATSVAHEVNNPLTIALTNTQLIMLEMKPGDLYYEMVEDIHYACNRISNIVANLVDFSSQEGYDFHPTNLIETIEDTLIFIAHPLREAGIEIERAYNDTPTIIASRNHLKTLWINLLMNACEAIEAGHKPGKIIIDIDRENPKLVVVQISDDGIGIPRKYIKNIFNPFFSTKPVSHSVGLGLFTARTIIDKHQGQINFKSKPGLTTFSVTLPEAGPTSIDPLSP